MIFPAGRAALLAALLGGAASPVFPQVIPDAGSTRRDVEKPVIELPRKPPPAPTIQQPERPALKPAPAVRFTLRTLRVTGNTAFAESELLPLVADLVGREVGFTELEEAAARITRFYRENGYPVARAYLPAQNIREGVVEIAVLEGRFGKIEIRNGSRLRDSAVASRLEPLQGRLIEERTLERRLLLLYDLPGAGEPKAALRPGANVGESDLTLELGPAPLITGSVDADNHGNRFTGANRLSAQINLLSPTGSGDLLSVRATKGDPGLDYGRLSYQLPIGGDGLKVGAGYTQTEYRLGRQFSVLEADGEARTWNGYASYPFVRSRAFNLYGQAGFEKRDFEDRVGATATVTNRKAGVTTLGLSGDFRDGIGGGGVSVFSLVHGSGNLEIQSPVAKAIDDVTARSDGNYHKWNLNLLRLQTITDRLSLLLSYAGQKAGKNLDSSEKFVLGGAAGVRAYPSGEASGDSGYLLSAELRYSLDLAGLPGTLQPFGFVDAGESKVNERPFLTGDNRRRLSAGGLGLAWFRASDFSVRLVIAHALGGVPASDTDRKTRGWLQAVKYF